MKFTSSHNYIKNTSKKYICVWSYSHRIHTEYWQKILDFRRTRKTPYHQVEQKKKNQDGTYVPERSCERRNVLRKSFHQWRNQQWQKKSFGASEEITVPSLKSPELWNLHRGSSTITLHPQTEILLCWCSQGIVVSFSIKRSDPGGNWGWLCGNSLRAGVWCNHNEGMCKSQPSLED